jgi:hypothetical protein
VCDWLATVSLIISPSSEFSVRRDNGALSRFGAGTGNGMPFKDKRMASSAPTLFFRASGRLAMLATDRQPIA